MPDAVVNMLVIRMITRMIIRMIIRMIMMVIISDEEICANQMLAALRVTVLTKLKSTGSKSEGE